MTQTTNKVKEEKLTIPFMRFDYEHDGKESSLAFNMAAKADRNRALGLLFWAAKEQVKIDVTPEPK